MSFTPIYMPNLSSYCGVLTARLTSIPHTVPCYVITILATYPAYRTLLQLTVLTTSVDLNKSCSFCLCNTNLATYPAQYNTNLATYPAQCNTNLATYPAQCNLLHITKQGSILIMHSQSVGLLNVILLHVFGLTFYMDLSFSLCYFLDIYLSDHDLGVCKVCQDYWNSPSAIWN